MTELENGTVENRFQILQVNIREMKKYICVFEVLLFQTVNRNKEKVSCTGFVYIQDFVLINRAY